MSSETDPFAGPWRDITSVLTDEPTTTPKPDAAPDRRVARLQARAAEKRTNRHDAIQVRAEERRTLREERRAARTEARELRAEKRADRADSADRAKDRALTIGRSVLVTAPILSPMAVAWTGQSQFAIQILGWAFAASVLYAAAYELTTVYWAWLYHQARTDGDSGWEYRLGTWIFATGAAVQQWWHYSDHWHATPRSVTYSVMSAVGVLLWEGRARLIHRRKLRAENKLAPARPRIGPARWVRYPVRSWTAWSLITLEGHRTLDAAWTAADTALRTRAEVRSAVRAERAQARRLASSGTWRRWKRDPHAVELVRVTADAKVQNQSELANQNRAALNPVREPSAGSGATNSKVPNPVRPRDICTESPNLPAPEPQAKPNPEPPKPREPRTVNQVGDRSAKRPEQVQQVLNLIGELGYEAVTLPVVQKRTGMSKTTAHHRLKEARDKWNRQAA